MFLFVFYHTGYIFHLFCLSCTKGLPGPTSTQMVVSAALSRAGPLGGLLAFVLWQTPGLIVLIIAGMLIAEFVDPNQAPWYLIGLPPAAIALVFSAFYAFAVKLDKLGTCLALFLCLVAILVSNDDDIKSTSTQWVYPTFLAVGGIITYIDSKRANPWSTYNAPSKGWDRDNDETLKRIGIPLWVGVLFFLIWIGILVLSIILAEVAEVENTSLEIFETMYRIGSIIFGGGQVVLPLLQDEVVPKWVTEDQFLQGLALTQSMPGPLFNFSAYLGAVYQGVGGALLAFLGLFGPGVILIYAAVPFWARLRHNATFRAILSGVASASIGLIGAACVILWESAIKTAADAMIFAIALTLNTAFAVPAPIVVLVGGVVGAIMHPDAADLGQQPYCIEQGFLPAPEDDTI
jgi:chromate transporter